MIELLDYATQVALRGLWLLLVLCVIICVFWALAFLFRHLTEEWQRPREIQESTLKVIEHSTVIDRWKPANNYDRYE